MAKMTGSTLSLLGASLIAGSLLYAMPAQAAGNGYTGLIAPSHDDATSDTDNNEAEPNVLAPYVPPPQTAADHRPQVSNQPGTATQRSLKYGAVMNLKPGSIKGPGANYANATHRFINGKTAMQDVIDKDIAYAMSIYHNRDMPRKEREQQVEKSYNSLSKLADGLRVKMRISDNTYRSMGLSERYIADEKHSIEASLSKLDQALSVLKP